MTTIELPPLRKEPFCSQCGQSAVSHPACGPTHAIVVNEWLAQIRIDAIEQDRARQRFELPENDLVGITVTFADGHKELLADVLRELADCRARPVPGEDELWKLIDDYKNAWGEDFTECRDALRAAIRQALRQPAVVLGAARPLLMRTAVARGATMTLRVVAADDCARLALQADPSADVIVREPWSAAIEIEHEDGVTTVSVFRTAR